MVNLKVYLAGAYSRRVEFRDYRDRLTAIGVEVTAGWIDTDFTEGGEAESAHCREDVRAEIAKSDFYDVINADVVIYFSQPVGSDKGKRGGRHVEFGIALGTQKTIILVGRRENVFHHLPVIRVFETFDQVLKQIKFALQTGVKG
jgi:predicted RNase H-like nuclease